MVHTLTTEQRAERRQKRLDKKRREALPLFATSEQVLESVQPLPQADAIRRELLDGSAKTQAMILRHLKVSITSWMHYRQIAERYITLDQIAYMETYCRNTLPPYRTAPEYRADYWRHMLRAFGLEVGEVSIQPTARMIRLQVHGRQNEQTL
jgi:hypothetical protein